MVKTRRALQGGTSGCRLKCCAYQLRVWQVAPVTPRGQMQIHESCARAAGTTSLEDAGMASECRRLELGTKSRWVGSAFLRVARGHSGQGSQSHIPEITKMCQSLTSLWSTGFLSYLNKQNEDRYLQKKTSLIPVSEATLTVGQFLGSPEKGRARPR